jgi:hypothetical protein
MERPYERRLQARDACEVVVRRAGLSVTDALANSERVRSRALTTPITAPVSRPPNRPMTATNRPLIEKDYAPLVSAEQ